MKKWEEVNKELITITHKGEPVTVKILDYLKTLVREMPKTRIGKTEKLVDHSQYLKDAYCKGGLDLMHEYAKQVFKDDYIRKSTYFWDIFSRETIQVIHRYFNIKNVLEFPIDIVMDINLDEFVKLEGVEELQIVEIKSMINHITNGKKQTA